MLPPVWPNAGLEVAYRRRILALVDEMHADVLRRVKAGYRKNEPEVKGAADAELPANAMQEIIGDMVHDWMNRFEVASQELARYFAVAANRRSDAALRRILTKSGIAVEFEMTPAQLDILQAVVHENVLLIRSIASQYLGQVQGFVMRSVQLGRDVGGLSEDIERYFGVTKRRAQLIARDQNNKTTAALNRSRQLEVGITKARWMHSHAGKQPRITHVKNDGVEYDVDKGWFDPDPRVRRFIHPGELINCRCTSQSIIPGFLE